MKVVVKLAIVPVGITATCALVSALICGDRMPLSWVAVSAAACATVRLETCFWVKYPICVAVSLLSCLVFIAARALVDIDATWLEVSPETAVLSIAVTFALVNPASALLLRKGIVTDVKPSKDNAVL